MFRLSIILHLHIKDPVSRSRDPKCNLAFQYLFSFLFFPRQAANLNSVRPPLISRTQTLTHAINLVGERLVLIGPKWDFSWLCATENDRLCVREVKTIWSHRSPERCQTNRKRNKRKKKKNLCGEGFRCLVLPFRLPSSQSPPKKQERKKNRQSIGHLSSAPRRSLEVDSYHLKKHKSLTHGLFMFLCNNQY